MPRQTRAQVDAEIIDRAAFLFARHGVAHTSLQRIADDVGYSKAGLLHRFANKDALAEAAIRAAIDMIAEVVSVADEAADESARDRILVEALVDNAISRPGISAFLNALTLDPISASPALVEASLELARAFGLGDPAREPTRTIQVLVAAGGVQMAVDSALRAGTTREWRGHIVAAALGALNHA